MPRTVFRPKLVTVTGTEKGCGVSAIAAGVATSLAETGERVLLVDMKLEHGVAQQFFLGRPCCGLDEALALETRDSALVQENLYVVTAGSPDERFQRILPGCSFRCCRKLQSSDYGYVIFDMPPVTQTASRHGWPDSWTWCCWSSNLKKHTLACRTTSH